RVVRVGGGPSPPVGRAGGSGPLRGQPGSMDRRRQTDTVLLPLSAAELLPDGGAGAGARRTVVARPARHTAGRSCGRLCAVRVLLADPHGRATGRAGR